MTKENKNARDRLINCVNHKAWWRTHLPSKQAIRERGLFLASSFREAEFYGRPLDIPFRVKVRNPLVGSFAYIERRLLGNCTPSVDTVGQIFARDKLMKVRAEALGFDSIVTLSERGYFRYKRENVVPRLMELNVLSNHSAIGRPPY